MQPVYKRILLKLSGEVLAGPQGHGIDFDTVQNICKAVKECSDMGVEIGLVVGGGNFWRGRSSGEMDRTRADHMGMLATVMNSLALADALEQLAVPRAGADGDRDAADCGAVYPQPCYPPSGKGPCRHLRLRHRQPLLHHRYGGRSARRGDRCKYLFKATNVDGVYDRDPNKFHDAVKFDTLSHFDILQKGLNVMDSTAASLCKDNNIPILVFNLDNPHNIVDAVLGKNIGTIVKED